MDVIIVLRIVTQENTPLAQNEQAALDEGQEQKQPAARAAATSKKVSDHPSPIVILSAAKNPQ